MKLSAVQADLARQGRSDYMNKTDKIIKIIDIVFPILFLLTFGVCALFGWRDVVNGLFAPSGENVGELLKMPIAYTIVCFVFLVVLCVMVVLGTITHSKVNLWISGIYMLLFVAGFIFLSALATGNITNEGLYNIVTYFLTVVLIPVYGAIWHMNFLFFIVLIPLFVINIVGLVKSYKR